MTQSKHDYNIIQKWVFNNDIPKNKWVYILYETCIEKIKDQHVECEPQTELVRKSSTGLVERVPPGPNYFHGIIIAWRYYE